MSPEGGQANSRKAIRYSLHAQIRIFKVDRGAKFRLHTAAHVLATPAARQSLCSTGCTQYTAPSMQSKQAASPDPCMQGWTRVAESTHCKHNANKCCTHIKDGATATLADSLEPQISASPRRQCLVVLCYHMHSKLNLCRLYCMYCWGYC
jgi:hypothetical protein